MPRGRRSLAATVRAVPVPLNSAGVLIYRTRHDAPEVLLVRPGGPYWRNRDRGAWQLPKGLIEPGEASAAAARREAEEELGIRLEGDLTPLGCVRQRGGKVVEAFALEHDVDRGSIVSKTFTLEWPPRSGCVQSFPEADAARWFPLGEAGDWILPSQAPFLERLARLFADGFSTGERPVS